MPEHITVAAADIEDALASRLVVAVDAVRERVGLTVIGFAYAVESGEIFGRGEWRLDGVGGDGMLLPEGADRGVADGHRSQGSWATRRRWQNR